MLNLTKIIPDLKIAAVCVCIIAALGGCLWVQSGRLENAKAQIKTLTADYNKASVDLSDAKVKISAYEKEARIQADEMKTAEVERQRRIATLSAQIAAMRKQVPPKDCKAASDWAIENKGDLGW